MKASNRNVTGKGMGLTELHFVGSRMEELEAALARSLANQKALQESLQEMIDGEERLREEFSKERNELQQRIDDLGRQLEKKSAELNAANRQLADFTDILQESKAAIDSREEQLMTRQKEQRRLQTIVREQKKHIDELQSDKLYNSIGNFECRACQDRSASKSDSMPLYELQQKYQKQIVELEYQLRRCQQSLQTQKQCFEACQKENMDFKRWLNRMVGVERVVVAGCQKVIMREIEKRLSSSSYTTLS